MRQLDEMSCFKMLKSIVPIIWFLLKVIWVLPPLMIMNIVASISPSWNHTPHKHIFLRIFMKQALSLCDERTFTAVLNPLSDLCMKIYIFLSESSSDCITSSSLVIQSEKNITYKDVQANILWYYKPANLDTRRDKILIFLHGGGYAIKIVPTSLFFLNRLTRLYPRTAIVILDYTVEKNGDDDTATPSSNIHTPLLELYVLYRYLSKIKNYQNIDIIGESAGSHLLLSFLLLLERQNELQFPNKVIAISPWCNPTMKNDNHRDMNLDNDSLSWQGLDLFTTLINKSCIHDRDSNLYMNIEHNFRPDLWNNILKKTRIFIEYSGDEILSIQIRSFIRKLKGLRNVAKKNLMVYEDTNGGHIEPLLNFQHSIIQWLSQPSIKPIIDFIED